MRKTIPFAFLFMLVQVRVFAQLSLPFFDDFAKFKNQADPTKWINSGVYVNDRIGKNPVTRNVATFNGQTADGKLNPSSNIAAFDLDTLTSKTINLAGRSAADSIYLSFFLQTGGLGNTPNTASSFVLEFKNSSGNWQQVFQRNGTPANPALPDFQAFFIRIADPAYFYSNFQFRFRNFGRIRILQDTWNLDYVYLNSGRTNKSLRWDVAHTKPLNSVLEHYTAMPIHQFNANKAFEVNDSLVTTVQNLDSVPRGIPLNAFVQVANNPPVAIGNTSFPLSKYKGPNFRFTWSATPNAATFNTGAGFQDIKSTIILNNVEPDPETRYNDSISRITPLHDYYAYDDGSAESVLAVVAKPGQIAHRFNLNQNDMVKALMVYLPQFQNAPGTQVTFKIWNVDPATGNPAGNGIFSFLYTVPALSQLDNWITIPVNPAVAVSGSFYVGWFVSNSQPNNLFSVGEDKNESSRGLARFGSSSTNWSSFSPGAIMLRPVMNNNITGLAADQLSQILQIFPNPATTTVNLRGNFEGVSLYDITGRLILEKLGQGTEMQLDVRGLMPGMYLLKVLVKNQIQTHKLLITSN